MSSSCGHSADTVKGKPVRLSGTASESLEAPVEGNVVHYDSEITGFGVRITAANAISFVLRYRINGRERRYTIGRYPELSARQHEKRRSIFAMKFVMAKIRLRPASASEPSH